ncbi:uncharacterized protein Osi5 [Eurosta solidaginis]|uniref:uncharacterized protein Osi5 n=1 Tax=Eurosta solidaginis TaxID=178769 RepID=UPI0035308A7F
MSLLKRLFAVTLLCVLLRISLSQTTLNNNIQKDTNTPSVESFLNTPPIQEQIVVHTLRPPIEKHAIDCLSNSLNSDSIYCRGSRAIRNIIHNLNRMDKPLVLMRGLEIVPANNFKTGESALVADDSFLTCISDYLRSHELNIKFSDLLADESERYLTRNLQRNGEDSLLTGFEEARKKDKGQGGIILAMAMMFGKMMAVMSLGGIGALALKALGVAMAALMTAGLLGLKSMMKGNESSHSVSYVTASEGHHHRRRRRSSFYDPLNLAYRGWREQQEKGTEIGL